MAVWAKLGSGPRQESGGGRSGRRKRWWIVALVAVIALSAGGWVLYTRARPYLHGSGCEVRTSLGKMPLDLDQGANGSTIAAVVIRKGLPERAAVISYATAIQESHMRNLAGGDRDSVGMFQQRPSQGWGSPDKLRDPVQSTSKFLDALVKVKDYLDLDLHDAAQRVQRSADGNAYAQHEGDAKVLAQAFGGRSAAGVRCWYPPNKRTDARRADALREMRRAFGSRLQVVAPAAPDYAAVRAPNERTGWAVASWAVTHAQTFGLSEVRFAGRHWRATEGHDGWTHDAKAPATTVIVR
ncbi:hypothetical protein AB0L06_00980 [Spirillospora sp. NPDC052269]